MPAGAIRMSLVIATRRRPDSLRRTLHSLERCDPLPDEVIVVDGDEGQSARPLIDELSADLGARYVPGPAGLTRQRNAGVEAASGDVVVFADDDVTFGPTVFAVLAEAFADPAVVGATGWMIEPESRRIGQRQSPLWRLLPGRPAEGSMTAYGFPRRITSPDVPRDVEFMHGCFMSARRDLARELRFDEELPGYGLLEDEDFAYRLSRRGRIRFLPAATVVHHKTGFSSHESRDFNRTLVVNRAYLFRKNFVSTPLARAQFVVLVAMLALHRLLNGDFAGVRGLMDGSVQAWRRGR